uniref:ATP synthase subunit b n=1 Tax=Mesenchytraeus cf. pedatus SL-2017 TaxID=2052678 RepID=A0A286Q4T4_9ANNE|nr:mitochondrial ATP synthase subunit b precursor [Mesenchytraeus cf. pedatus SL-2017]
MLSRIALTRTGRLSSFALGGDVNGRVSIALSAIRSVSRTSFLPSTAPVAAAPHAHPVAAKPESDGNDIQRTLGQWDAAHKIYFGPERDTVNFPIKVAPETSPPVRLGFIPEPWFQAFYDKTGVTGPYMFGGGMITYLLSKEIWIVEHGFTHFVAFWIAFYIAARKWFPSLAKYINSQADALEERLWWKPVNSTKAEYKTHIEELEKSIWREDGQKYVFEAKKENVDLQLESVYRQRLAEVHQSVKKRLDYQVDVQNAVRRQQQEHMVQWIVNGVLAGISPQQEKDSLAKCILDLKTIAAKSHSTAPA